MRKLIPCLYFLALISLPGIAQNLSLVYNGNPVANDEAVVFPGEPSALVIEAHIGVINNSVSALNVMCKKAEISLVPGSVNYFCWDNCYPPNVYVSLGPLEIGAGQTNNAFIGEYQPMNISGQSVVRYVFYVQSNPSDSVCFRALFNAYPTGLEDPEVAAVTRVYPNPCGPVTTVEYRNSLQGPALLVLRNTLGLTVREIPVPGGAGSVTLNTGDLADGIYFCSLVLNGKNVSVRKIIVNH
jgi:hypothetical protein